MKKHHFLTLMLVSRLLSLPFVNNKITKKHAEAAKNRFGYARKAIAEKAGKRSAAIKAGKRIFFFSFDSILFGQNDVRGADAALPQIA